jgi:TrkA domain protein
VRKRGHDSRDEPRRPAAPDHLGTLTVARIEETRLPGIGLRHDFTTTSGARIGMVTYRDGRRELLIFDERDPDECRATVGLSEDDARALADLLGGSQVIEHLEGLERE